MARLQDVILRGASGAQPAATTVPDGTLYFQTDTGVTQQSDGTNWNSYSPTTTGGNVTGTGLTAGVPIVGNGGADITVDPTLAQIRLANIILSDAQVKSLPTAHITLIASPGAGFSIQPLSGGIFGNTSSGAYTNIDPAATMNFQYGTTNLAPAWNFIVNDAAITNGSTTRLTDLLGTTTNRRAALVQFMDTEGLDDWGPLPLITDTTRVANQPIALDIDNAAAGNLTGGNAANSVFISLCYVVVPVP